MHLDSGNQLYLAGTRTAQCPHCGAHAQLEVTAAPDFDALMRLRPKAAGFVLHCAACHGPVFRKHPITRFGKQRIDFAAEGEDVERRDNEIRTQYLPDVVGAYYTDAVGCHRAGLLHAFASMCRMTVQSMITASGERSDSMQLRLYDEFDAIASVSKMDDGVITTIQDILFDTNPASIYSAKLDRGTAAILLEIVKDLLHQSYIRHGKLAKALGMRRFFANQHTTDSNADAVTNLRSTIRRSTGTAGS